MSLVTFRPVYFTFFSLYKFIVVVFLLTIVISLPVNIKLHPADGHLSLRIRMETIDLK